MASNYTTSQNLPTENYALPSAPIWTMPTDLNERSGKSMLISNNDQDLLTFNDFSASSAPYISDLPPDYFDISIVPNGGILHNNEVTPYTDSSKAKIKRSKDGVLSMDPLIDRNPDQLWLYFMTYLNETPEQKIKIFGHHTEVTTFGHTTKDKEHHISLIN